MGIKPVLIIKIYSCHRHYSPTGLPSKNCYITRKNLYDEDIYTIRQKNISDGAHFLYTCRPSELSSTLVSFPITIRKRQI